MCRPPDFMVADVTKRLEVAISTIRLGEKFNFFFGVEGLDLMVADVTKGLEVAISTRKLTPWLGPTSSGFKYLQPASSQGTFSTHFVKDGSSQVKSQFKLKCNLKERGQ